MRDQQQTADKEPGEGDTRKLPVPIDGEMGQEGEIAAHQRRNERSSSPPEPRHERNRKDGDEEYEADQAKLGQSLHVQAVRVLDNLVGSSALVPDALEAPGPLPECPSPPVQ